MHGGSPNVMNFIGFMSAWKVSQLPSRGSLLLASVRRDFYNAEALDCRDPCKKHFDGLTSCRHEDEAPNGNWTPSGYYSPEKAPILQLLPGKN